MNNKKYINQLKFLKVHIVLLMSVGSSVRPSVDFKNGFRDHYLQKIFITELSYLVICLGKDKTPIDFGFTRVTSVKIKNVFSSLS